MHIFGYGKTCFLGAVPVTYCGLQTNRPIHRRLSCIFPQVGLFAHSDLSSCSSATRKEEILMSVICRPEISWFCIPPRGLQVTCSFAIPAGPSASFSVDDVCTHSSRRQYCLFASAHKIVELSSALLHVVLESFLVLATEGATVQIDLINIALCIHQDLKISKQTLILLDMQHISHHCHLLFKVLYEALSIANTRNKLVEPLYSMIKLSVAPNEQRA
mmetsp:Transcript_8463/g.23715  ORF Transcript_8463/g.23715 Transcript_8463/m.23715 type:complete len:217 (-) Transcript_8463:332-982(-)